MKLCQPQKIIMKNEESEPRVMNIHSLILDQLG